MRIKPVRKGRLPCKVVNGNTIRLGHDRSCVNITLHKTIRIPDDGRDYPLPPSLGNFNVFQVDDYHETVPQHWLQHGGLFICMYQREAMWMKFDIGGTDSSPKALKVGVGKINAISGKKWNNKLSRFKNDYVVVPDQPWIDGCATGRNTVKQFCAEKLGDGYTVEAQKTGKEEFGGIQLLFFDSKKRIKRRPPRRIHHHHHHHHYPQPILSQPPMVYGSGIRRKGGMGGGRGRASNQSFKKKKRSQVSHHYSSTSNSYSGVEVEESRDDSFGEAREMGLGVGGRMRQKVYKDNYGFSKWDQSKFSRTFIHIVNSEMFEQITGHRPTESTITRETYTQYGYPWFEYYDERRWKRGIGGNRNWRNVKSVDQIDQQRQPVIYYHQPPPPQPIHHHQLPPSHHHHHVQYTNTTSSTGGLNISGVVNINQNNNVRDGNW